MARPLPDITDEDRPAIRQWLGHKVADRAIEQAVRDCPVKIDLSKIDTVTNDATAQRAAYIQGWKDALQQLYVISEDGPQKPPSPQYLGEDK